MDPRRAVLRPMHRPVSPRRPAQRGGFVLGLIVGLLIGLALALAVALYVTKTPVPFVNKVQQRTPEQDAAEAERNRKWDPNAPLAGKPIVPRPAASGAPVQPGTAVPPAGSAPVASPPATTEPPRPSGSARDPAAILSGQEPAPPVAIAPRSAVPGPDPFIYFVQVGAFSKPEDAEAQRAKLAMLGYAAKVTEREQSGRSMYRVRLGPYQGRDEAEGAQAKLQSGGETADLVRVGR